MLNMLLYACVMEMLFTGRNLVYTPIIFFLICFILVVSSTVLCSVDISVSPIANIVWLNENSCIIEFKSILKPWSTIFEDRLVTVCSPYMFNISVVISYNLKNCNAKIYLNGEPFLLANMSGSMERQYRLQRRFNIGIYVANPHDVEGQAEVKFKLLIYEMKPPYRRIIRAVAASVATMASGLGLLYLFIAKREEFLAKISSKIVVPALYFITDKDKALKHSLRKKIYEYLIRERASSLRRIAKKFNVGLGTVSWHLEVLKRVGLVKSMYVGKWLVFYPSESPLDEWLPKFLVKETSLGKTFTMQELSEAIRSVRSRIEISISNGKIDYLYIKKIVTESTLK